MEKKPNTDKPKRRLTLLPQRDKTPELRDPFENLWEASFWGVTIRIGHRAMVYVFETALNAMRQILKFCLDLYKATLIAAVVLGAMAIYEPRLLKIFKPLPVESQGGQSFD